MKIRWLLLLALVIGASSARTQDVVGFADHRGAVLAGVTLRNDAGANVSVDTLFQKPAFLVFAYHSCPQLCGLVLGEFTSALRDVHGRVGRDFDVVVVSIDPADTPADSAEMKRRYVGRYGGDGSGWHFLTGDVSAIRRLAQAAGFMYIFDPIHKTFAHAAGVFFVGRGGRVVGHVEAARFSADALQGLMDGQSDGASSAWNRLCGALGFGGGERTAPALAALRLAVLIAALGFGIAWFVRYRRRTP